MTQLEDQQKSFLKIINVDDHELKIIIKGLYFSFLMQNKVESK